MSDYYLSDLEKYHEGDEFPNVGYVRRMRALLNGAGEPQEPEGPHEHV